MAKIFFVDEAHFRADADLRGKWVLKGEPALVDSTSPRWGEKACYYSGVCLEAGEVEAMEIAGNSNAETSTAFLQQLRKNHPGPLVVIWDNGPAHEWRLPAPALNRPSAPMLPPPERNWGSRMAGIPSFPNIVIISRFKVSPGEAVALPAASGTSTPSALRLCQNCRISGMNNAATTSMPNPMAMMYPLLRPIYLYPSPCCLSRAIASYYRS